MTSTIPTADPTRQRLDTRSAMLARNWWVIALRGALGVLFGLLTLVLPGATLLSIVFLFAAYLAVDGILAIAAGFRAAGKGERWMLLMLEGALGLAGALAIVLMPDLAIVILVYLIALWSVISGIVLLIAAFQLHLDHGRWWLALAGAVSLLFGVSLAIYPITGAVVLALWIGGYALVFGAMLLLLGFRLRACAPSP